MEHTLFIIIIIGLINFCTSLEVVNPQKIKGIYYHIEGHFGPEINNLHSLDTYDLVLASPDLGGCTPLNNDNSLNGKVVLMLRGASIINETISSPDVRCRFTTKVYHAQQANAVAVIIGNNVGDHDIVPMYGETDIDHTNTNDDGYNSKITIPSMSISHDTFRILHNHIRKGETVQVKINNNGVLDDTMMNSAVQRWITAILSTLMLLASVSLIIAGILSLRVLIHRLRMVWQARQRRLRINNIPTIKYSSSLIIAKDKLTIKTNETDEYDDSEDEVKHDERIDVKQIENNTAGVIFEESHHLIDEEQIKLMDSMINSNESDIDVLQDSHSDEINQLHNETCNICLEDFNEGENIKLLRCKHGFHDKCITTWVVKKGKCPVCIRDVFSRNNNQDDINSNENEEDSIEDYDLYLLRI